MAFIHLGFYNGFAYGLGMGEIRLRTTSASGQVYVNGAYAGEVSKLKHIWLEPGAYNLRVSLGGQPAYEKRVYVLSGKALQIRPEGQAK